MHDDPALLAAVVAQPHDDMRRLVYADWLEERGDARAEYLRLGVQLKNEWSYENPCARLFARRAELARKIDAKWLAQVVVYTTPLPPVAVAELFPALRTLAKTTVRLHPRPGKAPRDASKLGGDILWPEREPWPGCGAHNTAYVVALQLRKEDFPEIEFRGDADLLQVLWCPNDHTPQYCPQVEVFWRKRSAIARALDVFPTADQHGYTHYIPVPCRLHPERVLEYPDPFCAELQELNREMEDHPALLAAMQRLENMPRGPMHLADEGSCFYQWYLSTADGTKVGGHPDWVQDPWDPACASCGAPMQHLLTFSSWEFDGGTWGRWLPIEDREVLKGDYDPRSEVQSGHKLMFGDAGRMYLFICRQCDDWPVSAALQCS